MSGEASGLAGAKHLGEEHEEEGNGEVAKEEDVMSSSKLRNYMSNGPRMIYSNAIKEKEEHRLQVKRMMVQ